MAFRTPGMLTAEEERALRRRLSPLAGVAPSRESLVRIHATIARGLTQPDVARRPGLRAWQRAMVVGVGLALPLAAGGVLAAMPGSPVRGIPGNVLENLGPVVRFAPGDGGPPSHLAPTDHEDGRPHGGGQLPGGDQADPHGAETAPVVTHEDSGMLGNDGDGETMVGHEACHAATAHARTVIEGLLARDDLPDDARDGLETALAALEACGAGNGQDQDAESNGGEAGQGHQACSTATMHAQEVIGALAGVASGNGGAGLEMAEAAIGACGLGSESKGAEGRGRSGEPPDTPQGNRPSQAGPPPGAGRPQGSGSNNGGETPSGIPPVAPGRPPEGGTPDDAERPGPGAHPYAPPSLPAGTPSQGAGPDPEDGPAPEGADRAPGPRPGLESGPPNEGTGEHRPASGQPPAEAGPVGAFGR